MAAPQDRETITQGDSLTPERFARVRAVFEAAVERQTGERRAFAAGACGGDVELLREVERMLDADDKSAPLLEAKPSSSAPDEGRFPAGTILGERYRILGLLGKGGMGEVYRTHDLKLEQQVALKFLPGAMARNSRLLERFRGEVRIARQISHRNVCRVYDLGEIDGAPFISMEYVDGEDLGSLLRRIGRLPGDKALEFARRLCAGLAAAHEKGVLHRDLKPANIMIDGRGQVLIMDFGLAAVADAVAEGDIRSGTPAYMAPEQKEGREVTVRSDLYSLGLVLAEMFTGQKASQEGKLSTTVKDLDPGVEKAIERCLERDPTRRPDSALALARMLPGGDPLAEALAAGETPSPEMVAASDDTGVLSVRAAVACLVFVIAGLAAFVFWGSRFMTVNMTPMPYPAEVLEQKAREMIARFGYTTAPVDLHSSFGRDAAYANWAAQALKPGERRLHLAQGEPAELIFSHSESPRYLNPESPDGLLTFSDPVRPAGAVDLLLDSQGRLRLLRAIPQGGLTPLPVFDWTRLFEGAGLDFSRWSAASPQHIPPVAFDARAAWTGTYPTAPQMPMRIEAAAWQGRPVYFEVFGPWAPEGVATPTSQTVFAPVVLIVTVSLIIGVWLAVRNLRSGRGDLDGAWRLAAVTFLGLVVGELNLAHHTPLLGEELGMIFKILGRSLFSGATIWVLYVSVEPYIRRHWPQVLIGWSRILSGHFRDPLVGGHVLAGIAVGMAATVLSSSARALTGGVEVSDPRALYAPILGAWAADLPNALIPALVLTFLFVLLRLVLRRTWLAAAVVIIFAVVITFIASSVSLAEGVGVTVRAVYYTAVAILYMAVAIRFGILALVVALIAGALPGRYPVTSDFSAFYARYGWLEVGLVLAVALWSFRTALGRRKVWKGDVFEG
jgi:serine/threonine-protein kinase